MSFERITPLWSWFIWTMYLKEPIKRIWTSQVKTSRINSFFLSLTKLKIVVVVCGNMERIPTVKVHVFLSLSITDVIPTFALLTVCEGGPQSGPTHRLRGTVKWIYLEIWIQYLCCGVFRRQNKYKNVFFFSFIYFGKCVQNITSKRHRSRNWDLCIFTLGFLIHWVYSRVMVGSRLGWDGLLE